MLLSQSRPCSQRNDQCEKKRKTVESGRNKSIVLLSIVFPPRITHMVLQIFGCFLNTAVIPILHLKRLKGKLDGYTLNKERVLTLPTIQVVTGNNPFGGFIRDLFLENKKWLRSLQKDHGFPRVIYWLHFQRSYSVKPFNPDVAQVPLAEWFQHTNFT